MPTLPWLTRRTRPLAISRQAPPDDSSLTKMQQGKMLWVGEPGGDPEVEWADGQPDLDKIKSVVTPCLTQLGAGHAENLQVDFLAKGTWNQVFTIQDQDHGHEFIFRVSLPVYPWYKTEAEVATIQFIRDNTTIPAPRIFAFDSSADNELGYEWILMERLPGVTYVSAADQLSLGDKLTIARSIAEWLDQLSQHKFNSVGSFFFKKDSEELQLDRPVIQGFMGDWRHEYHHHRGPFDNLHSYIRSFVDCRGAELFDPRQRLRGALDIIHNKTENLKRDSTLDADAKASHLKRLEAEYSELLASTEVTENAAVEFETFRYHIATSDDEAWNDFSEKMKLLARITDLVDTVYSKPFGPEDTVLYHWDISQNNVLIDPVSHRVTGLIDWEQLHTTPLVLLRSRYPPIIGRGGDFPDLAGEPTPPSEGQLRGGQSSGYSDSVDFWERQQMREEFDRRLRELQSSWLSIGKDSKDEAGGKGSSSVSLKDPGLCQKCYHFHRITEESRSINISEIAEANFYCLGVLEELEELEKSREKSHCLGWLK